MINRTNAGHYNMFQGATAFREKFANCGNEFYDAADAGTCGIGRASDGSIGTYEASFGVEGGWTAWCVAKRLSCWPTCHTGFVRVGAGTCDEGEFTSVTCVLPGTEGEATWDTEETELSCKISVPENSVADDCQPQPRVRCVRTNEV